MIQAPRRAVWQTITDASKLQQHLPGCESLTETAPGHYQALLTFRVMGIQGRYTAELILANKTPPEGYTLMVEGAAKPGALRGEGRVQLKEQEGGTLLHYVGDLEITGMIAQLGGGLLASAATKMAQEFFGGLAQSAEI